MRNRLLALFLLLVGTVGCSDKSYRLDNTQEVLGASNSLEGSSTTGNFISTAIKETNQLDIVLYPSELLDMDKFALVKAGMSPSEIKDTLNLFPGGTRDTFRIGRMSGTAIKNFIKSRTVKMNSADLQVAGMKYHVHTIGGVLQYAYFNFKRDGVEEELKDKEYYKVAISDYHYFSGDTFPSYFYGDSMNRGFSDVGRTVSAKKAVESYLSKLAYLPYLKESRAKYTSFIVGNTGEMSIPNIQGALHRTPFLGYSTKTKGIVTAFGKRDRFPGGIDVYIQDPKGDGRVETSDAIHIFSRDESISLELGDEIEISGIIYEEMTTTGMGRTSIQEVDANSIKVLSKGNSLPTPVVLGVKGRKIPDHDVSTWRGDLNFKPFLTMTDGIDFWESLEGMRISINDALILGFRGGQEEFEALRPKDYLNLYITADGNEPKIRTTTVGGLMIDPIAGDFNPEIIQIASNHLSKGIRTETFYNVGEVIKGEITGVLSYEKNIFGGGELSLITPEPQKPLTDFAGRGNVELIDREVTPFVGDEDHLTVATFNVENLNSTQKDRMKQMGRVVSETLKCPDIVNLVEIQDNNGEDFTGGSVANLTLERFIENTPCPGVDYKPLNIDPVNHNEGGVPGGNIRVSMIYNANRVGFSPRGDQGPLVHAGLAPGVGLKNNPGRVFPRSDEFKGTRKSIISQFTFKGENVYVIGNHFNSKLGDTSAWSNKQPVKLGSEERRSKLAKMINKFVQEILRAEPNANVLVIGDFNAYIVENPMKILEGRELKNLMTFGDLLAPEKRYTTNYNGNSQALDYIFASEALLNKEPELSVPHINSDYMGRLSDHDPLVARFKF
ncbi:MAG: 5'-nucleotidase C-terminal domain-containing protein [Bacteriovoracaceae bacterium]|nr:5'-nucleotidase C-terminal domain-containing protein [Bacteriovoracaceae bacterium]